VPETRRRSPRGQGAALRDDVLRAAMELLEEGATEDSLTMRAVATRVGVSVPSVYLHFADKQALLDAVCEEVFETLHTALKEASEGAPHPFEGLRRQGVAYVRFALAHPEHYRVVMMRAHPTAPAGAPTDLTIASGAFGHLVATVESCVAAGVYEGDPVSLSLRLWAATHGIASLLVAKPYFPWPPVEQLVDDTVCMAGFGLAAQARLSAPVDDLPALVERLDALR
jgi:AcrR family transcriptional regulator